MDTKVIGMLILGCALIITLFFTWLDSGNKNKESGC